MGAEKPKNIPLEQLIQGAGVRIEEEPKPTESIVIPDISNFDNEQQTALKPMLEAMADYLSMGIITDKFGSDHESRREWRRAFQSLTEYSAWFREKYNRNKLKENSYTTLVESLIALTEKMESKVNPTIVEKAKELLQYIDAALYPSTSVAKFDEEYASIFTDSEIAQMDPYSRRNDKAKIKFVNEVTRMIKEIFEAIQAEQ